MILQQTVTDDHVLRGVKAAQVIAKRPGKAHQKLAGACAAAALVADQRDVLLEALQAIAAIPDPKTGDRGPVRHARHLALCAIKTVTE